MSSVQIITAIIGLVFGISLFLFGMGLMGDGLKKVAGNKLESYLYKLTNTPLKGILLGAAVTAVIQSSSATSVMVVGFVNAGMMKVIQGIGIIMGANIGTSITGWILSLNSIGGAGIGALLGSTTIAAVFALCGILLKNAGKKDAMKYLGDIMLGFAVLMEGMSLMKNAMTDVGNTPAFQNVILKLSNPILGILIGIIFTAILQSASASIGVLQSISVQSLLPFSVALPMTMGIGIGAAAPVLMSGMQSSSKNGKRTALVYLINDLLGCIIWAIIFYAGRAIYMAVSGHDMALMSMEMNSVWIALLNTVYRILTIVVLAPFIKQINTLVFKLVKDDPQDEDPEERTDFDLLEERFLMYPDLALAQSHTVMNSMAKKARKNVFRAFNLLDNYSDEKFNKVQEKENIIDKYEDKLGTYLIQLTGKSMSVEQTKQISKFLHTMSDFERIGDHASAISKVARELNEKDMSFSDDATQELRLLGRAVAELINKTTDAFINDDLEEAKNVEPLRQAITVLCNELKGKHIQRLQRGECGIQQGFPFNDLVTNLERVSAHCSNIAIAMVEIDTSEYDTHEYLKDIKEQKDDDYIKLYDHYAKQYSLESIGLNGVEIEVVEVDPEPEKKSKDKKKKKKNK